MQFDPMQQRMENPFDDSLPATFSQTAPLMSSADVNSVMKSRASDLSTAGTNDIQTNSSPSMGEQISIQQAGPDLSAVSINSVVKSGPSVPPSETTTTIQTSTPSNNNSVQSALPPISNDQITIQQSGPDQSSADVNSVVKSDPTVSSDNPSPVPPTNTTSNSVTPTNGDTFDIRQKGETAVTLSQDLVTALSELNVQASGFGGTDISDGIAEFGIIGGAADVKTAKVDLLHDGGLTLKSGGTTVNLTDFVIDNLGDRTTLTGLVTLNGSLVSRAPLFDLTVGNVIPPTGETQTLKLENVGVALTQDAAGVLNQAFGVSAFNAGLNFGTAKSDIPLGEGVKSTLPVEQDTPSEITPSPTPSVPLQGTLDIQEGGNTAVTLSQDLLSALGTLQVEAKGFGTTDISDGIAEFDITGGAADVTNAKVDVLHDDGLTFRKNNTTVDVTDFIVDNLGDRATLSGLITVNGSLTSRLPLFDLNVSGVTPSADTNTLQLQNVGVTLSNDAATALNQAFGGNSFTPGFNIGTAQSVIKLS